MAIGEEEVFRGGFFNYFLQPKRGSPFVAMAASAGLFTVYHLAVYQNPQALLFVFSAGFILAFVDLQIGLIAPSMFGHIGNNIFAYGTGGLLAGVLASLTSPLMLIIVGAGFALFILIVVRRQQKGRTK
jgi:membrane protease YdiL (CAAX protease family)